MNTLRLGLIGLDTSHATAFTNLLNDPAHEHHVPGARVVAAFPGGSPDFPMSIDRVDGLRRELEEKHGVAMVSAIAELKDRCDAILLESVDGRVHAAQFEEVSGWGLPVFIDKPLTVSVADAEKIALLAAKHRTRVMTSSALRFAVALRAALDASDDGDVTGGDFFGPMALAEQSPGFFWYGIHAVEMLFTVMGADWAEVRAERRGDHDLITARRVDGCIGTVRGNRTGNNSFGGAIHRRKRSRVFDVSTGGKPFYASLLQQVVPFLAGGEPPVTLEESVRIIRFIEIANRSVGLGAAISLAH